MLQIRSTREVRVRVNNRAQARRRHSVRIAIGLLRMALYDRTQHTSGAQRAKT